MPKATREFEWQTWVVEERGNKMNTPKYPLAPPNERGSGDDLLSMLTNLWEETLQVSKIGIDDNFFDLGGQSLNAIILVGLIKQQLNKEISMSDAVKNPTPRKMAKFLESDASGNGKENRSYACAAELCPKVGSDLDRVSTGSGSDLVKPPEVKHH